MDDQARDVFIEAFLARMASYEIKKLHLPDSWWDSSTRNGVMYGASWVGGALALLALVMAPCAATDPGIGAIVVLAGTTAAMCLYVWLRGLWTIPPSRTASVISAQHHLAGALNAGAKPKVLVRLLNKQVAKVEAVQRKAQKDVAKAARLRQRAEATARKNSAELREAITALGGELPSPEGKLSLADGDGKLSLTQHGGLTLIK